jgi:hypothetical protein
LAGLGFIGCGLFAMLLPLQTLNWIGMPVSGDLATIEIRAFYGGLELALGALLLCADWRQEMRQYGLLLAMACFGGIAAARGLGMLVADAASPFMWTALGIELALGLVAAVCWRANAARLP